MSVPDVSFGGKRRSLALLSVSLVVLAGWTLHHVITTEHLFIAKSRGSFELTFDMVFGWLLLQLGLAWFERPFTTTPRQQAQLDKLKVTVQIPAFNEDPALLEKVLQSLMEQTRPADRIMVVDDGSSVDYTDLRVRWIDRVEWVYQVNAGKRHAQFATFHGDTSEVWITMDSDTLLHPRAIENGLKPFADPEVTSVAGLVLALNRHHNGLTRIVDLVITSWQVTSRSALSAVGNVLVNSGPFALYRASAIRKYEESYLNETFFGRPVHYSDDSLLTMYALLEGKTVQQTSAVAFTTWPESWSHHVRQQLRWCRGMFIRSIWRYKYLSLKSIAFWFEVISWVQFLVTTYLFITVLILRPVGEHNWHMAIPALVVSPLLTYAVTLRTLLINRSDETFGQAIRVWLLSPLIIVWGWVIFRPLRVWGILTCLHNGWGTRADGVEIVAT